MSSDIYNAIVNGGYSYNSEYNPTDIILMDGLVFEGSGACCPVCCDSVATLHGDNVPMDVIETASGEQLSICPVCGYWE